MSKNSYENSEKIGVLVYYILYEQRRERNENIVVTPE